MIELDFNSDENIINCAKLYDTEGNYQEIVCVFDFGSLIILAYDHDSLEESIVTGNFRYKKGLFYVTTVDKSHTYVFERVGD